MIEFMLRCTFSLNCLSSVSERTSVISRQRLLSLWSICTFKWLQKAMWSLLKWLDIIYIAKGHLTACTDRSGDQTHWLKSTINHTVAGACRNFSSPTKENWSAVKGNMSRSILYIVTVCQLETTNQFLAFFLFVCSFVLKYYDPPCFMSLTMYLCTHVCILLFMGLNITWAPCFYEVRK